MAGLVDGRAPKLKSARDSRAMAGAEGKGLAHGNELDAFSVTHLVAHHFRTDIAPGGVQFDPRQRCHEFHLGKTTRARLLLAALEQQGADAAPRARGVDEERADLRSLALGIEQRGVAAAAGIAAEQRRAE